LLGQNLPMKRLLIDYKKLDQETALLLLDTYPDGYGDEDIISFKNVDGDIIQAVELRTRDTLYLVKINKNTSHFISQALEQIASANEIPEEITPPDEDLDMETEIDGTIEEF